MRMGALHSVRPVVVQPGCHPGDISSFSCAVISRGAFVLPGQQGVSSRINANAPVAAGEAALFGSVMAIRSVVSAIGGADRPVGGLESAFYTPALTRQCSVETGGAPVHTRRRLIQTGRELVQTGRQHVQTGEVLVRTRQRHVHDVRRPKRSVRTAKRLLRRAKRYLLWLGRLHDAPKRRTDAELRGKRCRST
jgi:hypothetical protein